MSAQPRAAVYARVSSTLQEDNSSLDTQIAACRTYAAQHGLDVVAEFREVHTGVELWERPRLTELRDLVRTGKVDAVIAYSIDRLARDPVHLGVVLSEADYAGVSVCFVTEPLDSSPEGQLIRFVRGYAAKVEHLKIRERTMRGRLARVKSGRPPVGAKAPYGYRWVEVVTPQGKRDKVRLEPDPVTAPVVQRIFVEVASGTSARALARALSDEGIPSPGGNARWYPTAITTLLRHPVYWGEPVAWRWKRTKQRKNGVATASIGERPREEWIPLPPDVAPALITKEIALQAQARLGANKQEAVRNNHHPEAFLLRGGYARCGYCGRALTAYTHPRCGPVYRNATHPERYGCPRVDIQARLLDAPVWDGVRARLLDPDLIAREVNRLADADPVKDDLAALERRLADVDRKLRNLASQIADSDAPAVVAVLKAELERLADERSRLSAERSALEERRASWQHARATLDNLQHWVQRVAANLDAAGYATKRLALQACQVQVRVWNAEHTPRWQAAMTIGGDAIVFDTTHRSEHNYAITLMWDNTSALAAD